MLGNGIDFDCVSRIIRAPQERSPAAKRPLLDHDERFSDAVVVPEAGATEGTFLVEEVVHDLTPSSRYVHRDPSACRVRFFGKYSRSSDLCFGSRY